LHQALENGVSKYPSLSGRFPQVSGIQFEFNPVNEPGSRIDAQRILINNQILEFKQVSCLKTNC